MPLMPVQNSKDDDQGYNLTSVSQRDTHSPILPARAVYEVGILCQAGFASGS